MAVELNVNRVLALKLSEKTFDQNELIAESKNK
jgi:hypothetical protein